MTMISPPLWDGTSLGTSCLAVKLISRDVDDSGVARVPMLMAVNNNIRDCVVPLEQIGQFLRVHASAHLVCDNAGEMHRALHGHLGRRENAEVQQVLWQFVAKGRLADIGLLDQLIRLTQVGSIRPPRLTLQQLAQKYANIALRGEHELQQLITSVSSAAAHTHLDLVAEAGSRVRVIVEVFKALNQLARDAGFVRSNADGSGPWDIPALALQVKADVALAHIYHTGLRLAPGAIHQIVQACKAARDRSAEQLLADRDARQWLKREPSGRVKLKPNGSPEIRDRQLNAWLARLVGTLQGLHQTEIIPPLDNDQPSHDPKQWHELLGFPPLLRAWYDLVISPEVGRSFSVAGSLRLRPQYDVLPRLRSRDPDLHMLHRLGVQGAFEPAPGHVVGAVRLPNLKLCALAAVCRHRLGRSILADVLARGDDPCVYAAAQLAGESPDNFAVLRQQAPDKHERWLTAAHALLSIAPTGLSTDQMCKAVCEEPCLVEAAPAKVATWCKRLVEDVFSELGDYLRDDTLEVMAQNMRTTVDDVRKHLISYFVPIPPLPQLRKWYREYSLITGRTKDCLTALLEHCCFNPSRNVLLKQGVSDHELYIALFTRNILTLSGRARGRLSFSQAHGAEYLDLADDAIKSALFAVVEASYTEADDYKVVLCANATILIELLESPEIESQAQTLKQLAQRGAQAVSGGIPVACEVEMLHSW